MLQIALIALAITSAYSIFRAPASLRLTAVLLFVVPPIVCYGIAYVLAPDKDTRIYYPIAGAIFGWAIGALIYDARRKGAAKAAASSMPDAS